LLLGAGKNIAVIKIDVAKKGLAGLGIGAIIGIVVGAIAVIGIVIFLVIRKRN